jgi:hypothetical protein
MNNSTLTLQDLKSWLIRETDDQGITDTDIIDAINDFYSLVHSVERIVNPNKYRATSSTISLTASGTDLTTLTNIGDYVQGFNVYTDSVGIANRLVRRFPASGKKGYYISGNMLYGLNLADPQDIVIEYKTKGSRVAIGTNLASHTLQINQDLERAARKYVRASFFDGEYQFYLRDDAEDKAMQEIQRYFDAPANSF